MPLFLVQNCRSELLFAVTLKSSIAEDLTTEPVIPLCLNSTLAVSPTLLRESSRAMTAVPLASTVCRTTFGELVPIPTLPLESMRMRSPPAVEKPRIFG